MNNFINYLLEVNIALTIFIALYTLLLRNEKSFSLKRKLIVTSLFVAISTPLLKKIPLTFVPSSDFLATFTLPEIRTTPEKLSTLNPTGSIFWITALAVYFLVAAVAAIRFGIQITKLFAYTRKLPVERVGKYRVIEIPGNATFSFFHNIFIGNMQDLSDDDRALILQHEFVHVDNLHSLDRVFIELVQVVCWFNPLLSYYKKELIALHEFESDDKMIQHTDTKKYCNLLARVALMSADFNIANHFHNSLTSKRITMMKTESKRISPWKLGLIIPLMACVVVVVACQEQAGNQDMTTMAASDNVVYENVDNIAEFPGGISAMATFIGKNLKYPRTAVDAEGKVFVQFVVNIDGSVTDVKVAKGIEPRLDTEALRVVKLLPKWKPATVNGAAVRSKMVLPIRFALD